MDVSNGSMNDEGPRKRQRAGDHAASPAQAPASQAAGRKQKAKNPLEVSGVAKYARGAPVSSKVRKQSHAPQEFAVGS